MITFIFVAVVSFLSGAYLQLNMHGYRGEK
jgi:hypothetical protein